MEFSSMTMSERIDYLAKITAYTKLFYLYNHISNFEVIYICKVVELPPFDSPGWGLKNMHPGCSSRFEEGYPGWIFLSFDLLPIPSGLRSN